LYDVSGSSDFRNQTHDGFSIYRFFGDEENEPMTVFENLKTKMKFQGEIGGSVEFDYHLPSGRYYAKGTSIPNFDITLDIENVIEPEEIELPKINPADAFSDINNECPF
jgi:twinkle protein